MEKIRVLHLINLVVFVILKILSGNHESSDNTQLVDIVFIFAHVITIFVFEKKIRR